MKLHYMGKFDLNPESLPHGEHKANAVAFREAEDSRKLGIIANIASVILMLVLAVPAFFRCRGQWNMAGWVLACFTPMAILFPHELLHGLCFREDVYLYTNWKQGMLFVVGPEDMSKSRFVFMSLLPNLVFGVIPYLVGLLFPHLTFLVVMGVLCTGMGAGDYYNVFNALTQMPRGARTYLYGFHSYWYLPEQ